ncbi:MAG: hypothetical protein Gyms2KO_35220 [Gymnodinialimonas sp.]
MLEQRYFYHPLVGTFSIIALLMAVLALSLRKWGWLLAVPAPLLASFSYQYNGSADLTMLQTGLFAGYCAVAGVSILLYLLRGHLLSVPFAIFLMVLSFDAITVWALSLGDRAGSQLNAMGLLFDNYIPSLPTTILLGAFAVMLKMILLAFRDNRALIASLSGKVLRKTLWGAVKIWFPMPLIFIAFSVFWAVLLSVYMKDAVITGVTQRENAAPLRVAGQPPDTIRQALQLRADHEFAVLQTYATAQIFAARNEVLANDGTADELVAKVDELTGQRPASLQTQRCGFFDIGCLVMNAMKSTAWSVYQSTRRSMLSSLSEEANRLEESGLTKATDIAAQVNREVTTMVADLNQQTNATVHRIDATYNWMSRAMIIYSVIILIKTFLIAWSRILFNIRTEQSVAAKFQMDRKPRGSVTMKSHKQKMTIRKDSTTSFMITRRGVSLSGVPPRRRSLCGWRLPLARLIHRRWYADFVEQPRRGPDHHSAVVEVDQPAEIVSWTLRSKERAVFTFDDFVGMSEGLRLERVVSLSISTMILGRMIFYVAEGPGTLLLRTRAAARISPSTAANQPTAVPKLVAFGSNTSFLVGAEMNVVDTFLSGYVIKKSPPDSVVWDSSEKRGSSTSAGIMRFVVSFILPI